MFFTNRPNNISSTFGDIFVTQRAELLSYGLYLSIVATKTKHTATISTILTLSACRKVINAWLMIEEVCLRDAVRRVG